MARAQGRACSYVNSDIGATSPGRWHGWQLLWRIGRTAWWKVGAVSAASATELAIRHPDTSARILGICAPSGRPEGLHYTRKYNAPGRRSVRFRLIFAGLVSAGLAVGIHA